MRNLRESLGALIGRLVHSKPGVATEGGARAPLKGRKQVRAALEEAEARSEECRIALESRIQDVGFMRIQLRVRSARIAALEKEVSDLGAALAQRNEQVGKNEAAVLNDSTATLTATVAERDARIAALEATHHAQGETLAAANTRLAEESAAALAALELRNSMAAEVGAQRERVARLEFELADIERARSARIAALEKEVSDLRDALAQRNEQAAKGDAAVLNDTIAALTATVAERDASIAALKATHHAQGEALATRQKEFARALSDNKAQRKTLGELEATLGAANARLAEEKAAALAALEQRSSMESELGAQRQRVARLEAELADVKRGRRARIVALEKEVSDLGRALAQHNEQVGKSEVAVPNDSIAALTATVAERDASIAALRATHHATGEALAARQKEFAQALADNTAQRKALAELQASLAAANVRLAEEKAAALAALELRDSMEAEAGAQRQRVARLEGELADVEHARDAHIAAAAAVQAEYLEQGARLATASARVSELEAEVHGRGHAITAVQEGLGTSFESTRTSERDLHAAEGPIDRLEADLRLDASNHEEVAPTHDGSRGTSATLEGPRRRAAPHFIRTDESDVVHVLGSKTTIGRTADNDLQIDAQYISRHHAIILAGRTHTIIEDLNSTNGVIVNGRRVQRQTLKDGDIVLIGKAPFRFAVRPVAESR